MRRSFYFFNFMIAVNKLTFARSKNVNLFFISYYIYNIVDIQALCLYNFFVFGFIFAKLFV